MEKALTTEQRNCLIKVQETLSKISKNIPCFFNIVYYRDNMKLVKEVTVNNKSKWVLTEKGNMLLNVIL